MPISRRPDSNKLIRDMARVSVALLDALRSDQDSRQRKSAVLRNAISDLEKADHYIKQAVRRIR